MGIKVYNDRRVTPTFITVANQHENMSRTIDFDFIDCPQGHRYLILTIDGKSSPFLILGDKLNITSVISQNNVRYLANIVISDKEITDRINSENILFISDTFYVKIQGNDINVKEISEFPIPPELLLPYDELLDLIEKINQKLSDGEFNGKSAYTIAVENGFEGTEQEWLESLNGKPGKDGEPGKDGNPGFTPNIQIGTVTTLEAGQQATVERTGTNENPFFNFGIPKGEKGESGGSIADALQFAVKETAEGNPVVISDSADWENQGFELYGQSEQHVIEKNLMPFPYTFGNSLTANGVTFTVQEDKSIKVEGTATNTAAIALIGKYGMSEYPNIPSGFLRGCPKNQNCELRYFNEKLQSMTDSGNGVQLTGTTFTGKGYVEFRVNSGSTVNFIFTPEIIGTTEISPDTPSDVVSKEVSKIKFTGKNLFNVEWIKGLDTYENQSKNVARMPKGKYTLKVHGLTEADIKNGSYFAIRIKVGDTYTNTYWIMHPSSPNTKCLTGLYFDIVDDFEINLYIYKDTEEQLQSTYDTLNGHIQINNGNEESQYEPYKEQTVNLTEPITLRGIPVTSGGNITIDEQQYISDILCEKDGIYGIDRIVKQGKINEDYTFSFRRNAERRYTSTLVENFGFYFELKQMCNCMIYAKYGVTQDNKYTFSINGVNLDISTPVDIEIDEVNSMFNQIKSEIEFYGVLKESTFEPLPEADQEAIRKLKTFYPNTVIDTGCLTKIRYVADTKLYIDKKVQGVIQEVI